MNRETFEQQLVSYLDGNLEGEERRAFENFVRNDAEARRELECHRQADAMLGMWDPTEIADERLDALAGRVLQGAEAPSSAASKTIPWRWIAVAAAVAMLVFAARSWWRAEAPREESPTTVAQDATRFPDEPSVDGGEFTAELLEDPEFLRHFDVIRDLARLEEWGEVLDFDTEDMFYEAATLEVMAGV